MSTPLDVDPAPPNATGIASDEDALRLIQAARSCETTRPFAPRVIEFFSDLSARLLKGRSASRFPDVAAFGYWIRPSNLEQLRQRFLAMSELEGGVRVPRGLTFHVAPGNVEALFAYSWTTAALCGCPAIVKLSSRRSPMSEELIQTIRETLASHAELRDRWHFVQYPRERRDLNQLFISAAEVLAFWGGDAAITDLRSYDTLPAARVVTFPDRESLLLIRRSRYDRLDEADRDDVAERAARDIYTFGQAACSSPRYVVWVDDEPCPDPGGVAEDFYTRIGSRHELLGEVAPAEMMAKRSFVYELAARGHLSSVSWHAPSWLIVDPGPDHDRTVRHPAVGTIVELRRRRLADVTQVLNESDQTVTHFGFSKEELAGWVRGSAGPWPRRLRPVGQAVDFDVRWDGVDLLGEFTSLTTID